MGFISNVLEYGFTAGSIITKAERDADRLCKGIKTTIIEEDDEKEESDQFVGKIIFHPEWLPKEEREKWERMQQEKHSEPEAISSIKDAHTNIMNYLEEQNTGKADN